MKRINEILKNLNFPKFYEKCKEENGDIIYIFDNFAVREYNNNDNNLFLSNLPFTEDTIHDDDVEFIIQYLAYCQASNSCKDEVISYILKLIDNRPLVLIDKNGLKIKTDKIDKIVKSCSKLARELMGMPKLRSPFNQPKPKPSCSCSNEVKNVQEKLLTPMVEMLETIAGSMLKSIEQKEKKDGEYVFKQGEKGIKVEKASLKGPEVIVDKDFAEVTVKIPRCEKFDYNKKKSSELIAALEKIPTQEEYINDKDVKYIQKLMKDCVKKAKTSKKFEKILCDFLLKIVDSTTLGIKSPKIEKTFKNKDLGKIVMKKLDSEDTEEWEKRANEQEEGIGFNRIKKLKKLKKEKKMSLSEKRRIGEKRNQLAFDLKNLIKQVKFSIKSFDNKSEFGESKENLKKNLKKWKKELKKLEKK